MPIIRHLENLVDVLSRIDGHIGHVVSVATPSLPPRANNQATRLENRSKARQASYTTTKHTPRSVHMISLNSLPKPPRPQPGERSLPTSLSLSHLACCGAPPGIDPARRSDRAAVIVGCAGLENGSPREGLDNCSGRSVRLCCVIVCACVLMCLFCVATLP